MRGEMDMNDGDNNHDLGVAEYGLHNTMIFGSRNRDQGFHGSI